MDEAEGLKEAKVKTLWTVLSSLKHTHTHSQIHKHSLMFAHNVQKHIYPKIVYSQTKIDRLLINE